MNHGINKHAYGFMIATMISRDAWSLGHVQSHVRLMRVKRPLSGLVLSGGGARRRRARRAEHLDVPMDVPTARHAFCVYPREQRHPIHPRCSHRPMWHLGCCVELTSSDHGSDSTCRTAVSTAAPIALLATSSKCRPSSETAAPLRVVRLTTRSPSSLASAS